jgi:hypothetical protein
MNRFALAASLLLSFWSLGAFSQTSTTPGGCAGPTISVDNPRPRAGSTVNVTVACGPGNQKDWVKLAIDVNRYGIGKWFYLNGARNATLQFTAPDVAADRGISYVAILYVNDTYQQLAVSAPFIVPATVNPAPPKASLPASLAADPFTPQQVITVCASGCDFTSLGDAMVNAFSNLKVPSQRRPTQEWAA